MQIKSTPDSESNGSKLPLKKPGINQPIVMPHSRTRVSNEAATRRPISSPPCPLALMQMNERPVQQRREQQEQHMPPEAELLTMEVKMKSVSMVGDERPCVWCRVSSLCPTKCPTRWRSADCRSCQPLRCGAVRRGNARMRSLLVRAMSERPRRRKSIRNAKMKAGEWLTFRPEHEQQSPAHEAQHQSACRVRCSRIKNDPARDVCQRPPDQSERVRGSSS